MRRLLVALAATAGLMTLGPALAAPGWIVSAHSQLVSSTPGSGEVVASPPSRLVLVFSEQIDSAHTSLDLLDSSGRTIATGLGTADPSSNRTLVAPLPPVGEGTYTVNWRALSAADGHSTSGSLSFGIGNVSAGSLPLDVGAGGGDLHAGHDAGQILLEVQGRTLSDAGFMLAFGLLVVGLVVLRPAGRLRRGVVVGQAVALALGGASAVGLGLTAGATPGLDPIGFLASTQSGNLLVARAAVALVGVVVAGLALRFGRANAGAIFAGAAGAVGIALIAVSGHAAGTGSIGPIANVAVHVAAAATWLAGVVALAWLAISAAGSARSWLPSVVPRFSALGIVSVALVVATGAYTAWLETGDLTTIDSQYAIALVVKVVLVAAAIALGAFNLIGRGRAGSRADARLGGFGRRIGAEAVILVAVLIATANLASGSPPGPERPIPLAPSNAAGAAVAGVASSAPPAALAIEPGRPGPNAWWVSVPRSVSADAVELRLDRLDAIGSETVVPLRSVPGQPGKWVATGGILPADSRWTATVVLSHGGREVGRTEFVFAADAFAISEGRGGLPIDPALALAALLAVAAALGVAFGLAGGKLPLVDAAAGRQALVGGGIVGVVLAVALAIGAANGA